MLQFALRVPSKRRRRCSFRLFLGVHGQGCGVDSLPPCRHGTDGRRRRYNVGCRPEASRQGHSQPVGGGCFSHAHDCKKILLPPSLPFVACCTNYERARHTQPLLDNKSMHLHHWWSLIGWPSAFRFQLLLSKGGPLSVKLQKLTPFDALRRRAETQMRRLS